MARNAYLAILPALAILIFAACPSTLLAHDRIMRSADKQLIETSGLAGDIGPVDVVFVAEVHGVAYHHESQLVVLKTLAAAGLKLSLGLEMFRADQQAVLDGYSGGTVDAGALMAAYEDSWSYPWEMYEEIFLYAREAGIPLVGLNIADEIARKVAASGFASLSAGELGLLPEGVTCRVDEGYREYIKMAFGAHDGEGRVFKNFCEAQMLWDEAMARSIAAYLKGRKGTTVVVLSGLGHAWKPGIPARIGEMGLSFKVISPLLPPQTHEGPNDGLYDYLIN